MYVYKWKNPAVARLDASEDELGLLPELKLKESKKIHPGVSTFAENAAAVGPEHLQSLIETALDEVPSNKVPETPIFLMATAGVRFLPQHQQTTLLRGVCDYLQANTKFDLPDCKAHVQVISGETEGLYGWIAANYLLGGLDRPQRLSHGAKGHHTFGFLDMGGASAQIAFAPNRTEADRHSDDLKLVRLRRLDGTSAEFRVFTGTWLGFGANKARERYVQSLQDLYGDTVSELPDPCIPKGLHTTLAGDPILQKKPTTTQVLVGTGKFDECLRNTYPLLGKELPCKEQPCLLNGQHAPAIDFDINHFIGVSEFWHTTHGVFGKKQTAYDLATYQHKVKEFCSRGWTDIQGDLDKRKKTLEEKAQDAREACFKASWIINVLYDGIGIPRVGLEGVSSPGVNTTKDMIDSAKDKGFEDPFRPMDDIDGVELSWTLGKMVLYAAGQVEPRGSSLPVGFGSNVKSGISEDFQLAGSSPLGAGLGVNGDDDDDFDDVIRSHSKSGSGIVLFILLLIVIAYLMRKPEKRRKLWNSLTRRRWKSNGRKGGWRSSLTNKLFWRNSAAYERVLEEGGAAEFELGTTDPDENEYSDSSDGSRGAQSSGLATPQVPSDRGASIKPPFIMDRDGHVIRTESCERLSAPSVQMLNAGRRSRAGSPTRQKSPFGGAAHER